MCEWIELVSDPGSLWYWSHVCPGQLQLPTARRDSGRSGDD